MLIQYTKTIAIVILLMVISQNSLAAKPEKPKMDEQTWQEMNALKGQQAELETRERLLKLKTVLNLRDEQMSAWQEYEKHMLASSERRHNMRAAMHERRMQRQAPPTSLELAKQNVSRLERQLSHAQERLTVFSAFYNNLDDEQRQKVDKLAHGKIKRHAKNLREKRGMKGKHGKQDSRH